MLSGSCLRRHGSALCSLLTGCDQSIRVAGVKLPTQWRCVDYDAPNLVAYDATSTGGGRLHMRQEVRVTGTGSTVTLSVDYDLPGGPLGDLADRVFVERRNEREAEHSLQNLKDLVEGAHDEVALRGATPGRDGVMTNEHHDQQEHGTAGTIARGVLAGLAGTAVMTAFQKLIEMLITGREESFAPAKFAATVLPGVAPKTEPEWQRLNWVTHFALGAMWGASFGVAGCAGLRGQKAVAAVFPTVYGGDVLLNTALGLYEPSEWSTRDTAIDVVDKLVQAQVTGFFFDRLQPR